MGLTSSKDDKNTLYLDIIRLGDLQNLSEPIGEGATCVVITALYKGTTVAVKKFYPQYATPTIKKECIITIKNDCIREMLMMSKIKHPNVIKFLGGCIEDSPILVTEYAPHGNLMTFLMNASDRLSYYVRLEIARQIAEGMKCLHQHKIIHRDLKGENILVSSIECGKIRVIIADLGLSREHTQRGMTRMCGTPIWMAPEMLYNSKYTKAVDVYSFAYVLWELIARQLPHNDLSRFQLLHVIDQGIKPKLPSIKSDQFFL